MRLHPPPCYACLDLTACHHQAVISKASLAIAEKKSKATEGRSEMASLSPRRSFRSSLSQPWHCFGGASSALPSEGEEACSQPSPPGTAGCVGCSRVDCSRVAARSSQSSLFREPVPSGGLPTRRHSCCRSALPHRHCHSAHSFALHQLSQVWPVPECAAQSSPAGGSELREGEEPAAVPSSPAAEESSEQRDDSGEGEDSTALARLIVTLLRCSAAGETASNMPRHTLAARAPISGLATCRHLCMYRGWQRGAASLSARGEPCVVPEPCRPPGVQSLVGLRRSEGRRVSHLRQLPSK